MIRALDIRKGERWTAGRVALHMAAATAPEATLVRPRRRYVRPWIVIAGFLMAAPTLALVAGLTWQILLRGLR